MEGARLGAARETAGLGALHNAVHRHAKIIAHPEGDAGLDKTTKFSFGNRLVHNSYNWMFVIEDSGELYGQLVVLSRQQHGAAGIAAAISP
jgi:hypothetical protein